VKEVPANVCQLQVEGQVVEPYVTLPLPLMPIDIEAGALLKPTWAW
jgi:hypothetical protein